MGKGKVHPSPAAAAGGGGEMTAEAVLMRLLPAAVLAAAAPLGAEAKEVLAYLVLASLRSSAPPTPGREAPRAPAHRPELACGCFGCYTAYWSRWDGSPERDRDAIHRAIEAFEEHLARKEEEEEGAGLSKGRRGRKKRAAAKEKDKASKGKELAVDPTPPPPSPLPAPAVLPAPEEPEGVAQDAKLLENDREDPTTVDADEDGGGEEEKRRRGWGGVLNWRSWAPWGSH